MWVLSCDIHTHTPARTSYTNFLLYYVVIHMWYTKCLWHGHGYECHSPGVGTGEGGRAWGSVEHAVEGGGGWRVDSGGLGSGAWSWVMSQRSHGVGICQYQGIANTG